MNGRASADAIGGVRDGTAWDGDANVRIDALDALVARQVPLDEAARVPDGIRAYVTRKLSGLNALETVPNEALGDTDEAAAERCRRLFIGWAREAGIDRVRWIMKVEGDMEADVAAYADHEADGLLRLMALFRLKHRNEPDWDPGTSDEFAGGMLLRQAQDLSMGYRTRGMFGTSWKTYGKLSAAAQGKFEGHILRMVAVSHARRSAQVAAFNRKFDDRPLPTTKEEADRLMADMISEVVGRRIEPPTPDPPTSNPDQGSIDDRSPMREGAARDGSSDQSDTKAWLVADWFVRDFAPVWLLVLGPDDPAVILRETPALKSRADLPIAHRQLDKVSAMMNGVTETVGGSAAEHDLVADITMSCIGELTAYANFVAAEGGEHLGAIVLQALKLAGIAGTNYLVAGIHSAPPMFRNDDGALRMALRQALQPTMDASNATIRALGERLDAAGRQGNLEAAAPAVDGVDPPQAGDGIGPADIAGRTYSDVIASVKSSLTGDFKHDGAFITSIAESCGGHPQAKEIRRELGRMLHAIAPVDVKAEFDRITDGFESGFDQGLTEARALIGAGDVAAARIALEALVRRYGTGTGLYLDDSVSEYRHFANNFELALYKRLYLPTRQVRKLPHDRATLYSLYGAVLIEQRDADGAEEALREALRVNPVGTYAMFELGEVMKLSGRKREFQELTLRALEVAYAEDALGRAYRNLGYLAVEETDFDLAIACYCMSLGIDRDHAQAAQSELFYIQQVTGKTLALPDQETVEAILAKNGIQVGASQLVLQLMDSST
jgi:tetratricopeptide (TPR) repeat protein